MPLLFTLGHGQLGADAFTTMLRANEVALAVDIRRFAGSRRHPQFGAEALEKSLGFSKIAYRPLPGLGGRRVAADDSPNVALRNSGFRGYADHMRSLEFAQAFTALMSEGTARPTAMFCAETLWWQCHRRLVADALVLLHGWEVRHLTPGTTSSHITTPGVRREGEHLVYDIIARPKV